VKSPHRLVQYLMALSEHEGLSMRQLAEAAGISHGAVKAWAKGGAPGLDTFDRALGVFGYKLAVERDERRGTKG